MKFKILLAATSVVLLAAGCGKSTAPSADNSQVKTDTAVSSNTKGQGSFKDLIAMGKPLKCDSTFTSNGNASTGTTYIAGGKMRGDFSSQVEGKTTQMHMIVKDQTSYTWIEGMGTTMAFKSAVTQNNQNQSGAAAKSANVDQKVDYNCQSWTEDNAQFDLPAGVTFQDQSQVMPNLTPKMQTPEVKSGKNSASCAACDSAPASAKAQCLAALGCN